MDELEKYFSEERGRRVRLAEELGINPGAVSQWDRVPADRVVEIERITGVPRQKLRPDLYEGMAAA